MTYNQFKQELSKRHLENYYQLIVHFRTEIIQDCYQNGQRKVAPQLNLSTSKLSNIIHILKAIK